MRAKIERQKGISKKNAMKSVVDFANLAPLVYAAKQRMVAKVPTQKRMKQAQVTK